ncbi:hypothetical protein AY599_06150 [Leptolyngbya valderiana BDU 20041]|nr:hypothetical protein AY599_06150 [Leptolyngbya valderiana BDU 20041]PPT10630.1 hypothetical protein CKA32_000972 [Geitlerinema sp. FC II]
MTVTNSKMSQSVQYPEVTIERARRAVRCSPFLLKLYIAMREEGVFLGEIAGTAGFKAGYTEIPIPELNAENDLLWLINVGVLRREVDGQGITDSFRLTPLGRLVVREWQEHGESWQGTLTTFDRMTNWLRRWLRLPF